MGGRTTKGVSPAAPRAHVPVARAVGAVGGGPHGLRLAVGEGRGVHARRGDAAGAPAPGPRDVAAAADASPGEGPDAVPVLAPRPTDAAPRPRHVLAGEPHSRARPGPTRGRSSSRAPRDRRRPLCSPDPCWSERGPTVRRPPLP